MVNRTCDSNSVPPNKEIEAQRRAYSDSLAFSVANASLESTLKELSVWYKDGFIWITARRETSKSGVYLDWSNETELEVILTHEIGHVFGNGYIAGTVMDQDIARYLLRKRAEVGDRATWQETLDRLTKIDYFAF